MILMYFDLDKPLFPEPVFENIKVGDCTIGCFLDSREPHKFWCENPECEKMFRFFGIPTKCVWCGSEKITSGLTIVDNIIKERRDGSPPALRERS